MKIDYEGSVKALIIVLMPAKSWQGLFKVICTGKLPKHGLGLFVKNVMSLI